MCASTNKLSTGQGGGSIKLWNFLKKQVRYYTGSAGHGFPEISIGMKLYRNWLTMDEPAEPFQIISFE